MHWRNWKEAEVVISHPKDTWCALEACHNCTEHQKMIRDEAVSYLVYICLVYIYQSIHQTNSGECYPCVMYTHQPTDLQFDCVQFNSTCKHTTTLLACCTCASCHSYYSTISSLIIIIIFIIFHPTSLSITNSYHSHVYCFNDEDPGLG